MPNSVVLAIRSRKLAGVRAAASANPEHARHPSAIVEAAGLAWLPAIEILNAGGADLNAAWRNYRPLHTLIQSDPHGPGNRTAPSAERLACLDWLLDHGADPELPAAWPSARAIVIAAFWGRPEYVERLRGAGAQINVFASAALGDAGAVKRALALNPSAALDRDHGILTALHCAAGSRMAGPGCLAAARLLLDAGADPNACARSWGHEVDAAYFAAGAGRDEIFELLLDRGADPHSALSHAVWGGQFGLAERALAHGGQPDRATANGKPLLNDLIRWGRFPHTFWLLDHGASPNIRDSEGSTAAHQAASRGNLRLFEAVVRAGADLALRDRAGCTPLDVARIHKRAKLVAYLNARP